ncbi:MAG: GH3 auxin-responsive promoter family protein [Alphaproteobacteria bacterium]|nr:GH3 auxin-responsive promoter family protein [Alphaproteobacteria bacterium]MDD9919943.1 GH3 auxin-responsive promoter family protein [Alphaproteobacteria bacterium]
MAKFIDQQQRNLRKIITGNIKSSLFTHLGLTDLTRYKDFNLLYQSFARATPVQDYEGWSKLLRGMVKETKAPMQDILSRPHLVTSQDVAGLVSEQQRVFPVGAGTLSDYQHIEKKLLELSGIPKKNWLRMFDYSPLEGAECTSLQALAATQKKGWQDYFPFFQPKKEEEALAAKSRHQLLHSFYQKICDVGDQIELLIAPAELLTHFGLHASRQRGKFTSIKELCPNLKVYVQDGIEGQLNKLELKYLFNGLPHLHWLQAVNMPCGLMATQADAHIQQRLLFDDQSSCFYEFIPIEDVDVSGRFYRNFKRMHAGQVSVGKEYLLLLTNAYGLVAYNTGWIIKVLSLDPFHIAWQRTQEVLNAFGEGISVSLIDHILSEVNEILGGQGLFVRNYTVCPLHQERRHHWVIEVSRPLENLDQKLLSGIGKRLHAELELQVTGYRQLLQQGALQAPKITFVGMGTFAALPDTTVIHKVDMTSGHELVRNLCDLAGNSQVDIDIGTVF